MRGDSGVTKKIKFKVIPILILFVMYLLTYTNVYADDTCIGRTPDGVYPMAEDDVIMESETVVVDLQRKTASCEFHFFNSGEDKTIEMGFPGVLISDSGLTGPVNLTIHKFKSFIDGRQVAITKEKNVTNMSSDKQYDKFSEWFTFKVPFKKGERRVIKNTYSFYPTYDSMSFVYSGYVIRTGAAWKDNIGKAKVVFKLGDMKPYCITELYPSGFRYDGNTIVWENSDFEPNYDLRVVYNETQFKNSKRFTDNFGGDSAEYEKIIEQFNDIDLLAKQKNNQQLIELYYDAIKSRQNVLAVYIKSHLPQEAVVEETSIGDLHVEKREEGDYYLGFDVFGTPESQSKMIVSHIKDNGERVVDSEISNYSHFQLQPMIDYEIVCEITDWNGKVIQKVFNYSIQGTSNENSEPTKLENHIDEVKVKDGINVATKAVTPKKVSRIDTKAIVFIVIITVLVLGGIGVLIKLKNKLM